MRDFTGLGVAMVTPFTKDGSIDFAGLKRLTEHLIKGGVDYLVVQGTTGESPTLDSDEKRRILDFVLEVNNGRKPVVFGIGGNNTRTVCSTLDSFDAKGVSAILSVSPYYNKPTQAGLYEHYKAISEHTPVPVILYNVPGRTGSSIAASTTIRLAQDFKNIVAVKEASGSIELIEEVLANKPADFQVISGDDGITLPLISLGAVGVISVVGNAFPSMFGKMVHQALFGQLHDARPMHYKLRKITQLLFREGNPGGIKEVLKHMGICENHMRLPLVPVSEETRQLIYREIAENELIQV